MKLGLLKWVSLTFLLNSCGSKGTFPVCASKSPGQGVHPLQLDGLEDNLFLANWNGLTGVVAGTGVAPELPVNALCKIYLETVPEQSKTNGAKFYLWYNENCQPKGKRWLYLAFPKGYVKFDFTAKSSVVNPQAMNSSLSVRRDFIAAKIFSRPWSINEWLLRQHGPTVSATTDKTVSYNPYAHVIEEIEILPSSSSLVNDFWKLVVEKQLARRKALIPTQLEPNLDIFRNFFMEKSVLKRLLMDFSQSSIGSTWSESDYRYCPTEASPDECGLEQHRVSESLQKSLSPELWSEVKDFFYPSNKTIENYYSTTLLDRQPLNDAIRKLFIPESMRLRLPQTIPTNSTLLEQGFNDQYFSLPSVSEYALTSSPLTFGEPESPDNLIFVKNLQPAGFCSGSVRWDLLSRVTEIFRMGTNTSKFTLGHGGAMIGWGGIIPFAVKRPVWASCQLPPDKSGGASIMSLPEVTLSEDDIIPEADIAATLQNQKSPSTSMSENSPNGGPSETSKSMTQGKVNKTTSCIIR